MGVRAGQAEQVTRLSAQAPRFVFREAGGVETYPRGAHAGTGEPRHLEVSGKALGQPRHRALGQAPDALARGVVAQHQRFRLRAVEQACRHGKTVAASGSGARLIAAAGVVAALPCAMKASQIWRGRMPLARPAAMKPPADTPT